MWYNISMENKSNLLEAIIEYTLLAALVYLMVILPATLAYASHGLGMAVITAVFYTVFWKAILVPLSWASK